MNRLWVLLLAIFTFLLAGCSSKEDKAKTLAHDVLVQIYEKENYPQKFSDLYTLLHLAHSQKDGSLTYKDIEKVCKQANEIYKSYKAMRRQFSEKAKSEGVYEQYSQIMQSLFDADCTYAPTMALYNRIDNFCENVRIADKKFANTKQHKWAVEEAWDVFDRKFLKYYSEALKIKDKCFEMVK